MHMVHQLLHTWSSLRRHGVALGWLALGGRWQSGAAGAHTLTGGLGQPAWGSLGRYQVFGGGLGRPGVAWGGLGCLGAAWGGLG